MSLPYSIDAVVVSRGAETSILKTPDGGNLTVPSTVLANSVHEGDTVQMVIFSGEHLDQERERFAQSVLKEMLRRE